jgi:hypothetical protein
VTRLLDGRHHLEWFAMEQAGEVDYLIDQGQVTASTEPGDFQTASVEVLSTEKPRRVGVPLWSRGHNV